ncbi:hypothetical protein B0H16DRAFT_1882492 [Mycena metata]|uniref:Uncharacterized protein n=1 Tax=Mycena metata TaxID=1033252 RepID=A0AAD7JM44_9AGAR|nr:hypothetical protein B0H16DRAFT_1882492 [Mycena metata]
MERPSTRVIPHNNPAPCAYGRVLLSRAPAETIRREMEMGERADARAKVQEKGKQGMPLPLTPPSTDPRAHNARSCSAPTDPRPRTSSAFLQVCADSSQPILPTRRRWEVLYEPGGMKMPVACRSPQACAPHSALALVLTSPPNFSWRARIFDIGCGDPSHLQYSASASSWAAFPRCRDVSRLRAASILLERLALVAYTRAVLGLLAPDSVVAIAFAQ